MYPKMGQSFVPQTADMEGTIAAILEREGAMEAKALIMIMTDISALVKQEQAMVIQAKVEPQELSEKAGTHYMAAAEVAGTVILDYKGPEELAEAELAAMNATVGMMVQLIPAEVVAEVRALLAFMEMAAMVLPELF